ncbi:MAG: hypothetical protein U0414_00485 [Polyangiaceae bacterium]
MTRRSLFLLGSLLSAAGLAAVLGVGCDDGTISTSGSSSSGAGGDSGSTTGSTAAGTFSSGTSSQLTLSIDPADPILDVAGAPKSVALTAKFSDGTIPANVTWTVDDVVVGLVDATGTFTSKGFVAGDAKVTATAGSASGSTTVHVHVHIVENPGNLSASDIALLQAGGSADAAFKWLYPYDKTVFPRGLRAPELQLAGAAAEATYVKIGFGNYLYEGFFGAANPVRATLSPEIWKSVTASAKATDTVQVGVTKLSGGQATGPATEAWTIAQGAFKGSIYYNTYKSALTSTGAVMRVRPNVDASVFLGNCTVCHSVSANGNVVAGGLSWGNGNPLDSGAFDIATDGTSAPRYTDDDGRKLAFGALTPDGTKLLSNGVPGSGSPIRGLGGAYPSKLFDTATGAEIPTPTWPVVNALTPVFSPDGKHVAFNHYDVAPNTLGVMDVDLAASPPAFSNLADVATSTRAIAGWPSFLPDSAALVFHDGEAFDTAAYGGGPRLGEIAFVDLASKQVKALRALNGRNADGSVYLPFGEAEEANLDYEPTVLPIAVGGYYWVVFTSRRAYGNEISPTGTVPGGADKWGGIFNGVETPSVRKKLWVSAIDINHVGKDDPSHPAFYLGEQELAAGNMRAFAALDPCKPDGESCESGADCCGGFCQPNGETDPDGNPITVCGMKTGGCSNIDEACDSASDCCDPSALCINGHCAVPPPN